MRCQPVSLVRMAAMEYDVDPSPIDVDRETLTRSRISDVVKKGSADLEVSLVLENPHCCLYYLMELTT